MTALTKPSSQTLRFTQGRYTPYEELRWQRRRCRLISATPGSGQSVYAPGPNGPATHEGTWKVIGSYGDYEITYRHTDGNVLVEEGQFVTPDTMLAGVSNMNGKVGSGTFNHIHLEVRGPGGMMDPVSNQSNSIHG